MNGFSIRRRLLALLLGSVLAVWAGMLIVSYAELQEEIGELADARMEQSAHTLLLLDPGKLRGLAGNTDAAHRHHDDNDGDDDRHHVEFQWWSKDGTQLFSSPGTPAVPFDARDGYADFSSGGEQWRSFALHDAAGAYQVRVFEPLRARGGIARKIAGRNAQSLLLALPVLALLLWISVGRALAPLGAMSREVATRHAGNLEPVPLERVPAEVLPLAESLNSLLKQLAEAFDHERAFTADAAHELRTPLAAIQVQAEVALAAADDAQRRQAIEQVLAGARRAGRLIGQLLLLARLDQPQATPAPLLDLARAAADSAARQADAAARRGIELELDAQADCVLRADPAALAMLIDNLIDNAIKYGRDGGRVAVQVRRDSAQIELAVRDDGPGVPAELLPRLFDRFYRVPGSGAEGSGLGLSIVQRIARAYGGQASAGTGLDGGLGITVRFPSATT